LYRPNHHPPLTLPVLFPQPLIDAKELIDRLLAQAPPETPTSPSPTAPATATTTTTTTIAAAAAAAAAVGEGGGGGGADGPASPKHVARRREELAKSMRSIEAMVSVIIIIFFFLVLFITYNSHHKS